MVVCVVSFLCNPTQIQENGVFRKNKQACKVSSNDTIVPLECTH